MLEEFKKFAMRGNVVDMAVGIIIGGAFGTIVKSLVADVIRAGEPRTVRISLLSTLGTTELVPMWRYGREPSYYIYGGLVFCPLTLDYLRTWGEQWVESNQAALLIASRKPQ